MWSMCGEPGADRCRNILLYFTLKGVGRTLVIVWMAATVQVSDVYFHRGHWSYFIEVTDR